MDFSNREVPLEAIPRAEEVRWRRLDPRYRRRLQASGVFAALQLAVAGGVVELLRFLGATPVSRFPDWVPIAIWALAACLVLRALLWPRVSVPRMAYAVRERDVLYRRGVFRRVVEAVPFNRIQHSMTGSGFLDRRFGLAWLSVNTAGDDLEIPGLAAETAERLRRFILNQIGSEPEDEPGPGAPAEDDGDRA